LFPVGPNPNVGNWSTGKFLDTRQIVFGELRKVIVSAACSCGFLPTWDLLVNWDNVIPVITFGWWEFVNLSINVIANTNLDGLSVI
jgi:hypothetical protein